MTISDEAIRQMAMSGSWRPGQAMTDEVVRAWFEACVARCLAACQTVVDRHPPWHYVGYDPGKRTAAALSLASRTAAENCARAIQFSMGPDE